MKRIYFLLIFSLSVLLLSQASAQILVYQFRSTARQIGGGNESSRTALGYLIWKIDGNRMISVAYSQSGTNKRYRVTEDSPVVTVAVGNAGRTTTSISRASVDEGRYLQDFSRGQDTSLRYRSGGMIRRPRVLKGTSHLIEPGVSPLVTDTAQVAVYSEARTVAANDAWMTSEEILEDILSDLESRGYLDVDVYPTSN